MTKGEQQEASLIYKGFSNLVCRLLGDLNPYKQFI